jgi:hypothetical protein
MKNLIASMTIFLAASVLTLSAHAATQMPQTKDHARAQQRIEQIKMLAQQAHADTQVALQTDSSDADTATAVSQSSPTTLVR